MKRVLVAIVVLMAILAARDYSRREIVHPPGILVPESPLQQVVDADRAVTLDEYRLQPRARLALRARVLSREDYRWGEEAELSPMDLALGWGEMSDQAVLDRIEVTQGSRWYFTRYERPAPIPEEAIMRHSGNMHMIPADRRVEKTLRRIRRGDIVRLAGFLVDVDHDSGFYWRTSLSREDTGAGSCEIVYLERIEIEPRG